MDEPDEAADEVRVLSVADWFNRGGGAEHQLANLLPILRRRGLMIDVIILFASKESLAPDLRAAGFCVDELELAPDKLFDIFKALLAIRRALRAGKYQLIWSQLGFSNLLCAALSGGKGGARHVATFRSEGYGRKPRLPWHNRIFARLEGHFLGRSTRVAVSRPVAHDWQTYFGWKSFHVIHNGVRTDLVSQALCPRERAAIRARFGLASGERFLLTPARLAPVKGHIYLIEALAILKQKYDCLPRALAFGSGALADELLELADRRGVSFQVYHPLPQRELLDIMQSADAVVMPSLGETFGNVAAEAMLLGTPVVLTRTDGFTEIVGDSGCALMAPTADPSGLAEAIRATLVDPDATARRVDLAKTRAAKMFTLDVTSEKWETLFRQVIRDGKNSCK